MGLVVHHPFPVNGNFYAIGDVVRTSDEADVLANDLLKSRTTSVPSISAPTDDKE